VSGDIFISLRTSTANDAPMGSSRVENQTTWEGFVVIGRLRKTERIALSPCVRGWAAPKMLRSPCREALKLGAPCTLRSRSRARPRTQLNQSHERIHENKQNLMGNDPSSK